MKIAILDGYALNPGDLSYDCIRQFGEVTEYAHTETPEQTVERIGDSEIVLLNKVPITAEILDRCPNLQLICVQATGYNVVDCDACKVRGVLVTNVPSYGTGAVAQFTLALMLELCHRIGVHDESVHRGAWVRSNSFCYWLTPQMELAGKTLGIIGYGRIGQAVAALAVAFGMRVLAYSRSRGTEGNFVELDALLRESDFVSLHCPLTAATKGIINRQTISQMKKGAMLINTARGALVDEAALSEALVNGQLAAAAVDVISEEPMRGNHPLMTAPNCIITPHMAWAPKESRQRLLECVVENIRCFLAGEPQNVVNR